MRYRDQGVKRERLIVERRRKKEAFSLKRSESREMNSASKKNKGGS